MTIKITNGEAQIDSDDYELVSKYKWHRNDLGYAVWRGIVDGKKQTIRMHRLIMGAPKGMVVDHINHDTLDNRKSNLRICLQAENMRNRRNQARGYYFDKRKKRWTIDSDLYKVKSVCVDSEEGAKAYIDALAKGGSPERQFTTRRGLTTPKLTIEMMRKIDEMFKQGHKRYKIAQHFGLSPSAIGRYLSGKTWQTKQRYMLKQTIR
jgi:hypothetical protein